MDKAFGIFAKQPRIGFVKTRLAQATSPEWAQRVAEAMLLDSIERFRSVSAMRWLVYAPDDAASYFQTLAQQDYSIIAQSEGDLGARLRSFFADCRSKGHERVVVVGSDSPIVPVHFVDAAFQLLLTNDVVIGPALDGGYYLVGGGPRMPTIFDDIPWSTSAVLERTIERVAAAGARLELLTPCSDVDTVDDWAVLRGQVLGMRQDGRDPGLRHIEKLL
jgi:rSAM/selenodomain-associated transferase 1